MPQLSDKEIIKRLHIGPKDRVLDIGGSARQHEAMQIDTIVDLARPEETPYWTSELKAKHFVQCDITKQTLPFKDKEFDVCVCTHTLEDLYDPFLALKEISRVAKRGYIATPSRGKDIEFSHYDVTDWLTGPRRQPGQAHHHWLFEKRGDNLYIVPKIYPILYTPEFHITGWTGEDECRFFWENSFSVEIYNPTNIHELIDEYRQFMSKNKQHYRKGFPLVYLDNPLFMLKAWAKYFLKKGMAFSELEKKSAVV